MSAYRAALTALTPPLVSLPALPLHVVLVSGTLSYQAIEVSGDLLGGKLEISPQMKTTPVGVYTLIMAPYATSHGSGDEPSVRSQVGTAAGLLGAINGPSLTFEHVYDNIVHLDSEQTEGFSQAFRAPTAFGTPQLEADDLRIFGNAATALHGLDEEAGARTQLALHWFSQATHDDGLDQFIKLWIALEALAIPNANVRPLNELLASAYGLDYQTNTRKFGVGKLQGFRSRILHNGLILPVHSDLTNYTRAIFTDALLASLSLPSQHRADRYAASPQFSSPFDLDKLLHIT